jgi:hypothetical protein
MLSTEQQSYTEPELVAALKKHDNQAYRHLYIHYRGALFNIITQLVPDTETANDILQEVVVTIWKNIDKYDPGKGFLPGCTPLPETPRLILSGQKISRYIPKTKTLKMLYLLLTIKTFWNRTLTR